MNTLIDAHCAHCRETLDLSPVTVTERRRVLQQADRELPRGLAGAHQRDLQAWLGRGLAATTRRAYRSHLTGFYTWACDPDARDPDDPWPHNPTSRLPKVRVPRGLPHPATLDELRTALRLLPDPFRRAVLLAAYGGLRCCELAILQRRDVTADLITVRGKGGHGRIVDTHPLVWAEVGPLPPGPVVPLSPGVQERRRKLSSYLWWHLHRIGLTHLSAHSFRHFFATELYELTQDILLVQQAMGHASPNTTAIYAKLRDGKRGLAIRALPAVA